MMRASAWARAMMALAVLTTASAVSAAGDGNNIVYIGAGPARSDSPQESDRTPFSLGFLRVSQLSDAVFGIDIAGEGTRLDSTWGQNQAVEQGVSINFLFGRNLSRSANSRFDAALVIGARHKTADCPPSYLGYQCYANTEPDVTYALNYGVLFAWTTGRLMMGLRATGASAQGLIGFSY